MRLNQQPSWLATNSLSAAEALKSIGEEALALLLRRLLFSHQKKRNCHLKAKIFFAELFFNAFGFVILFLWGFPLLKDWNDSVFWGGHFFSLRMTIYFPSSVPLPRPSVSLEESGL